MSGWKINQLSSLGLSQGVTGRRLVPSSLTSDDVMVVIGEKSSLGGQATRRVLDIGQKFMSVFGLGALAFAVVTAVNPGVRAELAAHLSPDDVDSTLVVVASDASKANVANEPQAAAATVESGAFKRVTWSVPGTVRSIADIASRVPITAIDTQARQALPASAQTQSLVAEYIAKRYRLAVDATRHIVAAAYQAGKESGLDPLLILSIMATESSFNPLAESSMGAQGLMQVMTRVHQEKYQRFGGTTAAFDPFANIKVGALVLRDCIARGGSLADGLRMYVGSTTAGDGGYGAKVLFERARMQEVAQGKRVPLYAAAPIVVTSPAKQPVPAVKPVVEALDEASTGGGKEAEVQVAASFHGA